jgi:VanZ family protein
MWQEKGLVILCCITILAVLVGTLWPFDFYRSNGIRLLPGANGIQFSGAGLVVSKSLLSTGGTRSKNFCSLEILLRPAGTKSIHTIVSFYVPGNPKQLLVRQWDDGLFVSHDSLGARNEMKTAKFEVEHAFQQGELLLVTLAFGPDGTTVYLNGSPRQTFSTFAISQSDCAGQIVMGTSPVRYDPWQGEVRGLAIYSKELNPEEVQRHYREWTAGNGVDSPDFDGAVARYCFRERTGHEIHSVVASGPDLEIPETFEVPHKAFLQSPIKHFEAKWYYAHDVMLNIALFMPVGFLLALFWGQTRNRNEVMLFAIFAGAGLSFVIEVLQAYIPQRDSGWTDIITNTLGAGLGATLAQSKMILAMLRKTKPMPA